MNESESTKVSVGIDVSKSLLDISIHETGESWSCSNDASGAVALVDKLRQLKPTRIVLEATGVSRPWLPLYFQPPACR